MSGTVRYTVETLRSGQPRPYAATERECLIRVEIIHWGKKDFEPWLAGGDVEATIKRDEEMRTAGQLMGGQSPAEKRKFQMDWAKKIVKTLFNTFRERSDDDGRTGMDAAFYPTLRNITLDYKAGTIRALITEEYTD